MRLSRHGSALLASLVLATGSAAAQPATSSPGSIEPTPPAAPQNRAAFDSPAIVGVDVAAGIGAGGAIATGLVCFIDGFNPPHKLDTSLCFDIVGGILYGSAGLYALGGPTVHLFKGRPGRAVLSLGLRVAAPIGLGYLGYQAGDEDGAALAGVAGLAGAVLIDWFVLGKEEPRPTRALEAQVHPTVVPRPGGATLGLTASF